jgi:hypothetical protein
LRGSEQLRGPERTSPNDTGKAANGSSGEAEKTKKAKLETTASADNTAAQRKENNASGNGGAGGSSAMTAAMARGNGGASSAGRDKEIGGGRGKKGVLTWFAVGAAARANGYLLCLSRRSALT